MKLTVELLSMYANNVPTRIYENVDKWSRSGGDIIILQKGCKEIISSNHWLRIREEK